MSQLRCLPTDQRQLFEVYQAIRSNIHPRPAANLPKTMTIDLNIVGNEKHQLALYFFRLGHDGRHSAVEIYDLKTLKLLALFNGWQLMKRGNIWCLITMAVRGLGLIILEEKILRLAEFCSTIMNDRPTDQSLNK